MFAEHRCDRLFRNVSHDAIDGFAGATYAATALICGAALLALAFRLHGSSGADRRDAARLFGFSIFYLFMLFAALLADHRGMV